MVSISIIDNGCGMSPDFLESVIDPFVTTRTTRKVGLGIPLLKLAAEQAEGDLTITSSVDEADHGTTVTATFRISHLDTVPVGDMGGTISTLIQGSPDIDFEFRHESQDFQVLLDTRQMREILGAEVPLSDPEIIRWIAQYLQEQYKNN